MTNGEQKILMRGVAAGTLMGIAIGLIIALFVAMKPEPHLVAVYVSVGMALLVASAFAFFGVFAKRSDTNA